MSGGFAQARQKEAQPTIVICEAVSCCWTLSAPKGDMVPHDSL